jgi:hypothetical protein
MAFESVGSASARVVAKIVPIKVTSGRPHNEYAIAAVEGVLARAIDNQHHRLALECRQVLRRLKNSTDGEFHDCR